MDLFLQYKNAINEDEKEKIREKIFPLYEDMIYKMIHRMAPKEFKSEIFDMVNNCVVEFCHALDKFNPDKKIDFSTYLYFYIQKGMWDYCYKNNLVHISRNQFHGSKKCAGYKNLNIENGFRKNFVWLDDVGKVSVARGESYDSVFKLDKKQLTPEEIHYDTISRRAEFALGNILRTAEMEFIQCYYFDDEKKIPEVMKELNISHWSAQDLSKKVKKKIKEHEAKIKKLIKEY